MPELKKLSLSESTPAPIVAATTAASTAAATVGDTAQKAANTVTSSLPKKKSHKFLVIFVAVLLGVGTGFALNNFYPAPTQTDRAAADIDSSSVKVGDVVGASDKSVFKDQAEGVLQKGGIEGEGSHRLLRPGGDYQTVYLTSSVVDLDALLNHKVRVWGETFNAQKAGWLMDVGRVEVLELNAAKPE